MAPSSNIVAEKLFPGYYYYPLIAFDVMFPPLFGMMTLLNPMQALADQLPPGWDKGTDLLLSTGVQSPRIALFSIIGAVMGPVWAITTFKLLPLARYGMVDRPDLAEKVIMAHLVSGAIIDPLHFLAMMYYYPTELLLSPKEWHAMLPIGFIWITILTFLKAGWCLGIGRASAKDIMVGVDGERKDE